MARVRARACQPPISLALHPHPSSRTQVHISLTGRPGEMGVDFVTSAGSGSGLAARFGTSAGALTSVAPAVSTSFTGAGWTAMMNAAYMTGLLPATTYFYQVGSDAEGWSATFSFVNQPEAAAPPVFAVFADFGFGNDISMSDIIADAAAGGFDMILHAGDVAYDLDSGNSQTGNSYMNAIQPATATKPYMFATGNHESYGTQGGGRFLQFAARFSSYAAGVGNSSGSGSPLWYSFNVGQIHFLFFCTENVAAPLTAEQMAAQLAFMTADLKAVNRDVTPWVVSVGHKFYSMDTLDWQPYEDVLNPGGVDLHMYVCELPSCRRFAHLRSLCSLHSRDSLLPSSQVRALALLRPFLPHHVSHRHARPARRGPCVGVR